MTLSKHKKTTLILIAVQQLWNQLGGVAEDVVEGVAEGQLPVHAVVGEGGGRRVRMQSLPPLRHPVHHLLQGLVQYYYTLR